MKIRTSHEYFASNNIAKHIIAFNYKWLFEDLIQECNYHYVSFSESGAKRYSMIGQWNVKLKNC